MLRVAPTPRSTTSSSVKKAVTTVEIISLFFSLFPESIFDQSRFHQSMSFLGGLPSENKSNFSVVAARKPGASNKIKPSSKVRFCKFNLYYCSDVYNPRRHRLFTQPRMTPPRPLIKVPSAAHFPLYSLSCTSSHFVRVSVIATEKTDLLFRKLMQKQEGLVRAPRSCTTGGGHEQWWWG